MKIAHVIFRGKVQGVNFRNLAKRKAETINVKGIIRNLSDGTVEGFFSGDIENIAKLIEFLTYDNPQADVENVEITWEEKNNDYDSFEIIR